MKIRENLDIKWFGGFASRGGWYLVVISYVGFGGSTSIVGGWLVVIWGWVGHLGGSIEPGGIKWAPSIRLNSGSCD